MDSQNTETHECKCPVEIQAVAQLQGISCQRLFRYAYEMANDYPAYSLAIFMQFVEAEEHSKSDLIPLVVRDFLRRVGDVRRGINPTREESCSGCMLSEVGHKAVSDLCKIDFPEVNEHTLFSESSKRRTAFVLRKPGESFTVGDQFWLALMESGAPDSNDETWDQLVLHNDEES
ncbi:hypothetical protein KW785_03440 [Candidatus Parcubacteria bacterium]|nr:hypothetical protein [Candidatus Parcubacteria bacterium]